MYSERGGERVQRERVRERVHVREGGKSSTVRRGREKMQTRMIEKVLVHIYTIQ